MKTSGRPVLAHGDLRLPPPPAGALYGAAAGVAPVAVISCHAARGVQIVALGLAGGGVGHVGVQRMPVVGGLLGAAGAGDRAEAAGYAGASGGRSRYRGSVLHARAVAGRVG